MSAADRDLSDTTPLNFFAGLVNQQNLGPLDRESYGDAVARQFCLLVQEVLQGDRGLGWTKTVNKDATRSEMLLVQINIAFEHCLAAQHHQTKLWETLRAREGVHEVTINSRRRVIDRDLISDEVGGKIIEAFLLEIDQMERGAIQECSED